MAILSAPAGDFPTILDQKQQSVQWPVLKFALDQTKTGGDAG
jgi:hypothetical protein